MAIIAAGSTQFIYRVVGVCIRDGHVLLHREDAIDFWVLPGGRALLHEASRDTLLREMEEEIGQRVSVGRLLWVVENFFTFGGTPFHELALYFEMTLPAVSENDHDLRDFTGSEGATALLFRWFPLVRIETVNIKPSFLRTALPALPETPIHVVHVDPAD